MPVPAPYGGWRSPIAAAVVAAGEIPLGSVDIVDGEVYWAEGKPLEGGRVTIVRLAQDGTRTELVPAPFYARTRAHEYGGGAYVVHGSTLFFANFADQRLYRLERGSPPQPITPAPGVPAGERFADAQVTADGQLVVCVREIHLTDGREAINEIAVVPTDGSAPPRTILSGHDFYAYPRLSPNGSRLAWQTWDHPRMPWDGSDVWVGDFAADGSVSNSRHVAGGARESIFQVDWSPSGELHFVSDRTGWWNLYRLRGTTVEPLAPLDAEFGVPQWVFGMSTYAFLEDGRIACIVTRDGFQRLAYLDPTGHLTDADLPYTAFGARLRASGQTLVFNAGSPTEAATVVRLDTRTGRREVLRRSVEHAVDPGYVARPRAISFPTEAGAATGYAIYYPPTNADFQGQAGERPPLIVASHGGPTAMTQAELSLRAQFWTSRGFGLVDVNYGGSTGFGRAYRERLNGKWGLVDVDDCINAARYLAEQGEVDGRRLAIRGGSAGGYTTLCALVFHDDFAAGASYYGVADCETLATDTHKFESRYLDTLIGPYPAAKDVYYQRSPIHFADRLRCPVILFQGLEDRIVPPSQAERMVEALQANHVPHAYVAFEGEQHGFRKAETIQRTLEAELYFYGRVFHFDLAEPVEPVDIENLD